MPRKISHTITPSPAWAIDTRQDGAFMFCFFLQQILTLPCKTQPDHVFPILYCSILVGPCKMLEAVWTFSSDIWLTDELFLLKEMTLTGNCLFFFFKTILFKAYRWLCGKSSVDQQSLKYADQLFNHLSSSF